jgi:hypothetical protein
VALLSGGGSGGGGGGGAGAAAAANGNGNGHGAAARHGVLTSSQPPALDAGAYIMSESQPQK